MKIIVSHDIDHLYWSDHLTDTFIPGLVIRSFKELLKGKTSVKELGVRLNPFNKLHNISELSIFLEKGNIPATFFFAVKTGLNLSYKLYKILPLLPRMQNDLFHIGIHGISYSSESEMKNEARIISNLLNKEINEIGIRNHYLRQNECTFQLMSSIGYKFDSTDYGIKQPYKIGSMWEFPISLMDVYVSKNSAGQNLKDFQEYSLQQIDQALSKAIPYFVLNFHDVYFQSGYKKYRDWFIWIVDYFHKQNFEFISFSQAVEELNR